MHLTKADHCLERVIRLGQDLHSASGVSSLAAVPSDGSVPIIPGVQYSWHLVWTDISELEYILMVNSIIQFSKDSAEEVKS